MRKPFLSLLLVTLLLSFVLPAADAEGDPTIAKLIAKYGKIMYGVTITVKGKAQNPEWTPGVRLSSGDVLISAARLPEDPANTAEFRVKQGKIRSRSELKTVNQLANIATVSTSVGGTGISFAHDGKIEVGGRYYLLGVLPPDTGFRCEVRTFMVTAEIDYPTGKVYATDLYPGDQGIIGCPVFDSDLKAVGFVNTVRADGTGTPVVFPSSYVRKAVAAAIDPHDTNLKRCWFGAFTRELTQVWCEKLKLPKELQGSLIEDVVPGSPAAAAGLRTMDVVTAVNGVPVAGVDAADLEKYFASNFRPNQTVKVSVFREGKTLEIEVKLTERPTSAEDAPSFKDDDLGLEVRDLTTYLRLELGIEMKAAGVVVAEVYERKEFQVAMRKVLGVSYDYNAGLVIVAVNGSPTASVGEFETALKKAKEGGAKYVTFFVRYNKSNERGCLNTAFLRVRLKD
ncbi:MAG: hypothetical protein DRP90_06105 [Planctomycetota bacterium]|nr:MAG: hypothetical protein DRP90_06105 [Planctomycetota bacterium]